MFTGVGLSMGSPTPVNMYLRSLFSSASEKENGYLLSLSEDEADDIRNLCGDQLVFAGLDEDYNPNQEGEILQNLMDKFFVS